MRGEGCLAALAAVSWFLSSAIAQTCSPTNVAGFDFETSPTTDLTIYWAVDEAEGIISFQAEYAGDAWVSVGFSDDELMVGSDAVIGLPGDSTVLEYDMTLQSLAGVNPSPVQEVSSTSINQDAGSTVLAFTRPLVPAGAGKTSLSATPGAANIVLWATGRGNPLSIHAQRGGAVLDLGACDEEATLEPVTTEEEEEEEEEEEVEEALLQDCLSSDPDYDFQAALQEDLALFWSVVGETVAVKVVYEGEAWVGVGFSASGGMFPADAVVGLPAEGTVLEYDLTGYTRPDPSAEQEISDATITQDGGVTTLTFVRPLAPTGNGKLLLTSTEASNWIYGVGSTNAFSIHAERGSVSLVLGSCQLGSVELDRAREFAHGWLMTLAWGVFMPMGIMIARFAKPKYSWWITAHKAIQSLAFTFALVGFIISIVFTNDYGVEHFAQGHPLGGLLLTILMVLQVGSAFMRPHAVPKPWDPNFSEVSMGEVRVRKAWEFMHKIVGGGTVIWAIFQIFSGFGELDLKGGWAWTYTIVLILLVVAFLTLQCFRITKPSEDEKHSGHAYPQVHRHPTISQIAEVTEPIRAKNGTTTSTMS